MAELHCRILNSSRNIFHEHKSICIVFGRRLVYPTYIGTCSCVQHLSPIRHNDSNEKHTFCTHILNICYVCNSTHFSVASQSKKTQRSIRCLEFYQSNRYYYIWTPLIFSIHPYCILSPILSILANCSTSYAKTMTHKKDNIPIKQKCIYYSKHARAYQNQTPPSHVTRPHREKRNTERASLLWRVCVL